MSQHLGTQWQQRLAAVSSPLPGSRPYCCERPLRVPGRFAGLTLAAFLRQRYPHHPEHYWAQALAEGRVSLRGRAIASDAIVQPGAKLLHREPEVTEPTVNPTIGLIYEDDVLLALDKPAPLPVHPCGRFCKNTLTGLLALAFPAATLLPVHRLDAETSGLLLLAKTRACARALGEQFAAGAVEKRYLVEVEGRPSAQCFRSEAPIALDKAAAGLRRCAPEGQAAITNFRQLSHSPRGTSLLEARPHSGRTNQIRLHLAALGLPIIGDRPYREGLADDEALVGQGPIHLHAWALALQHPAGGEPLLLEAPAPAWALETRPR